VSRTIVGPGVWSVYKHMLSHTRRRVCTPIGTSATETPSLHNRKREFDAGLAPFGSRVRLTRHATHRLLSRACKRYGYAAGAIASRKHDQQQLHDGNGLHLWRSNALGYECRIWIRRFGILVGFRVYTNTDARSSSRAKFWGCLWDVERRYSG
jgi:hypothetical protein